MKSFFFWYAVAQGMFIFIIMVFDFFSKLDVYLSPTLNINAWHMIFITFMIIPKGLWMTMPVAIMFGIAMTLSNFYQNNELIAIYSSKISIYKFVLPLIVFCFSLSIFMIFLDSFLVIPTFRYRENLYEHLAKKKQSENDITIKGENNYFWNVEDFVSQNNMLKKIIVFKINDNYKTLFRLDASSAVFSSEGWVFRTGTIREWDNEGKLINEEKFYKKNIPDLAEKPSVFKNIFKKIDYDIEKMTIPEAKERLVLLKKLNISHNDELLKYYKKFSFPFTLLIVCLFAIGVSTISQRNILILSLFFSIGLAIVYYVMQMILDILASVGTIPSFIGAWFTIILFLPVSIYLVRKAKT